MESEGYQVTEAEDGLVALQRLREVPVSVVVLDLAMPVLDGFGFLDRLDDPPPPWVIVYSAFELYSREELGERFKGKVFRSLRKPIPPLQLILAVGDAIGENARRFPHR